MPIPFGDRRPAGWKEWSGTLKNAYLCGMLILDSAHKRAVLVWPNGVPEDPLEAALILNIGGSLAAELMSLGYVVQA